MRNYNDVITLNKNRRGIYDLDTIKGCRDGLKYDKKGCYSNCYAAAFGKQYGYNFGKSTKRYFNPCFCLNEVLKFSHLNKNSAQRSVYRIQGNVAFAAAARAAWAVAKGKDDPTRRILCPITLLDLNQSSHLRGW